MSAPASGRTQTVSFVIEVDGRETFRAGVHRADVDRKINHVAQDLGQLRLGRRVRVLVDGEVRLDRTVSS